MKSLFSGYYYIMICYIPLITYWGPFVLQEMPDLRQEGHVNIGKAGKGDTGFGRYISRVEKT